MIENRNPVLDFDWKKDIDKVRPPYKGVVQPMSAEAVSESIRWGTTLNANWCVQADPLDYLVFADSPQILHPVHALIWKETLDKYLCQYSKLKEPLYINESQDNWIKVELPAKIMDKLTKYENNKKKGNAKFIPVNTDYFLFVPAKKDRSVLTDHYKTPANGHACYVNLLCRHLDSSKTAPKRTLTPQYDGSRYRTSEVDLPKFELIDYWWHEKMTSISLTIEIASIFIEVREKYPDNAMWDMVFEHFAQEMLPVLVKSDFFFARITVARHFFQQILVELMLTQYEWGKQVVVDGKISNLGNSCINRAISFADLLIGSPELYDLPCGQIEKALSHIEALLGKVVKPVNFSKLGERTLYGLALFCNPNHENVKDYLDLLEREEFSRIPNKTTKNNKLVIFAKVRDAVKKACMNTESATTHISDEEILGKNPPKCMKVNISKL